MNTENNESLNSKISKDSEIFPMVFHFIINFSIHFIKKMQILIQFLKRRLAPKRALDQVSPSSVMSLPCLSNIESTLPDKKKYITFLQTQNE